MSKQVNIIKESNLNKVRSALKELKTATKPQLAEITGLSVVTMNSLINTLLESYEVIYDSTISSETGRPAAVYKYNSMNRLTLVIYMHEVKRQDKVFYCVVNLLGEIVERYEQLLSNPDLESFDLYIGEIVTRYPQIKSICFGIPGQEVDNKLIIIDYENMKQKSLSQHINDKFNIPVIVENDVNAAVMGYCHKNHISNDKYVIGIFFPDKYPPGAGIYINGDLYKGRDGLAGEISFLPFDIDWKSLDYTHKDREEAIIKIIQSFMCMYNPDTIVIYGENIDGGIINTIDKRLNKMVQKIMLPQIVISNNLNNDFEIGIKQIGLRMIEIYG